MGPTLQRFLDSAVVDRLGWTLLHSLWQGAAVAATLTVALALLRRRGPRTRYAAACAALAALTVLPAATFLLVRPGRAPTTADSTPPSASSAPGGPAASTATDAATDAGNAGRGPRRLTAADAEGRATRSRTDAADPNDDPSRYVAWPGRLGERARPPGRPNDPADGGPSASRPAIAGTAVPTPPASGVAESADPSTAARVGGPGGATDDGSAAARVHAALPWAVAAWAAGVLVLSLRNLGGWLFVRRLRHRAVAPVGAALEVAAARLGRRLAVARPVLVRASALVGSPVVVGLLRPVVLLPASLLTGMPPAELEALLAHELAHLARRDPIVNLLQVVVETLLFYHPAAWWVSARARAEREHCCDDLAVAATGDRAGYVRALAAAAEAGRSAAARAPGRLALAAASGPLLGRVRRLLGAPPAPPAIRPSGWLAGAATVGLCAVAAVLAAGPLERAARTPAAIQPSPATRPAQTTDRAAAAAPATAPAIASPATTPTVDAAVDADPDVTRALAAIFTPRDWMDDADAWLAAVGDLTAAGRRAVPALSAKMRTVDSAFGQAVLAMTVRSIGDRRAVPALIYALGRSRVGGSDFGVAAVDSQLQLLLMRLQSRWEARAGGGHGFADFQSVGRPMREITNALEALTGHSEGSAHVVMFTASGRWPDATERERDERERLVDQAAADRWLAWWEANKAALLSPADLAWADAHGPAPFDGPPPAVAGEPVAALALTVVSATDGRPLAGVALEVWADRRRYAASTGADGTAVLPRPRTVADRFTVVARRPGSVPTVLYWPGTSDGHGDYVPRKSPPVPLPDRHTLRLADGVTVGGTVVDDAGRPIEGAVVRLLDHERLSGDPKAPAPGDARAALFDDASAVTDVAGRWQVTGVPATLANVAVRVSHLRYVCTDEYGRGPKASADDLRRQAAVLTLKPMFPVRGRVVDAGGRPVPGARVVAMGKDSWEERYPDATADADGRFGWDAVRPGPFTLAAGAAGFAPAATRPTAGPDAGPVTVTLPPARTFRGRTVDPDGRPVAGVAVVLRTNLLLPWETASAADGTFDWPDAPPGAFGLAAFRSGYETAFVDVPAAVAGPTAAAPAAPNAPAEPTVVTLRPAPRIEATVVDARTGRPIDRFRYFPGVMFGDPPQPFVHRQMGRPGEGGRFAFPFRRSHVPVQRGRNANDQIARVEAPGYRPANSRPIGVGEGLQRVEFRLEPAADLPGRLVDADGQPVAGADVLIGTAVQPAYVSGGRFDPYNRKEGRNLGLATDADGRFVVPAQAEPFRVVALHDRGWAEVPGDALSAGVPIRLLPWGKVAGTALDKGKPDPRREVSLRVVRDDPLAPEGPVQYQHFGRADADGRFAFDRVQPGVYRVSSNGPMRGSFVMSSPGIPATVRSGQTTAVTLGADGKRPVTGRLAATGIDGPVDWSAAKVRLLRTSETYDPTKDAVAELTPASDGSFRFPDVPAGVWAVEADAPSLPPLDVGGQPRARSGKAASRFEVPGGTDAVPLDLGELAMKPSTELAVGQSAPPFAVRTVTGRPLALADFKGKYVLLDFWAVWCGPCVAEIPHLKAVHEAFGKDDRLAMVSLSLDHDSGKPKGFAAEQGMTWAQGFLGDWYRSPVPNLYGVNGIPATFLIGPDGTVLAKNLRGEAVKAAVAKVLAEAPPTSRPAAATAAAKAPETRPTPPTEPAAAPAKEPAPTSRPAAAASAPRVLLVTDGDDYFLGRALGSLAVEVVQVAPAKYDADPPAGYGFVVFDGHRPARPPAVPALYFGATPPGSDLELPGDGRERLIRVRAAAVTDWDKGHPLLDGLSMGRVFADQTLSLRSPAPAGWAVLARGEPGPLVLARDGGPAGRAVVVGFPAHRTNWPLQSSFPTFLRRAARWLTGRDVAAPPADGARPEDGPASRPAAGSAPDSILVRVVRDDTGEPVAGGRGFVVLNAAGNGQRFGFDDRGEARVPLPPGARQLVLSHQKDGFEPLYATVGEKLDKSVYGPPPPGGPVPAEYTLRVRPGLKVGGVVRDDAGRPVAGARVDLSFYGPRGKPPGDRTQSSGEADTDAAGRWSYDGAPADAVEAQLHVRHPDYVMKSFAQPGDRAAQWAAARKGEHVSTIRRGSVVEGVVFDPAGRAVPGAQVGADGFGVISAVQTDPAGRFVLRGVAPGEQTVSAKADGFAPGSRNVTVPKPADAAVAGEAAAAGGRPATAPAPLEIRLAKGLTLRCRVVDDVGKPVAGVAVLARPAADKTDPNGEFAGRTGADGRLVWDAAPPGPLVISLSKPDRPRVGWPFSNGLSATAGGPDEYTWVLPSSFNVGGTVVDDATGKPVPAFVARVTARTGRGEVSFADVTGEAGRYAATRAEVADTYVVRVTADGYVPEESAPIAPAKGGAPVVCDLRLKRGVPLTGTVLQPDGRPAAGADVMLREQAYPMATNGEFQDYPRKQNRTAASGADGTFTLPPRLATPGKPAELVVLHPAGWVEAPHPGGALAGPLTLRPWCVVSGVVARAGKPLAWEKVTVRVPLTLDTAWGGQSAAPALTSEATTDADGRFTLDRVVDGEAELKAAGRTFALSLRPGDRVTDLRVGGTGRTVVGVARIPAAVARTEPSLWTSSLTRDEPEFAEPDDWRALPEEAKRRLRGLFEQSPEYRRYVRLVRQIEVPRTPDGSFRIEDVPPGRYTLTLGLQGQAPGESRNFRAVAWVRVPVVVPEADAAADTRPADTQPADTRPADGAGPAGAGRVAAPLDLGAIDLRVVNHDLKAGDVAPPIDAAGVGPDGATGKRVRLDDFKGKYVLVDFWATWCGPCVAEFPGLKALHEQHAGGGRFAILGLSTDNGPAAPGRYARDHQLPWAQAHVGVGSGSTAHEDYGVQGVPSTWLIGPDGRIVAVGLRGKELADMLDRLLPAAPSIRPAKDGSANDAR